MDLYDEARTLKVIDIWREGNPTGIVTDRRLYDPALGHVDRWQSPDGCLLHGTVGSNSLNYLARGSIADGRYVSAHYLVPKDAHTLYKLVPDNYGCNHAGSSRWRGLDNLNTRFFGIEIENWQNGRDPFTESQYIKTALCWAYLSARYRMYDINLTTHAQVALPLGRRNDPLPAGDFSLSFFYGVLFQIRQDIRIYQHWGLPMWSGQQWDE